MSMKTLSTFPLSCYGLEGKAYTIGKKIGSGGEGDIHLIDGDETIVAKLYHQNLKIGFARQERKLKTMIAMHLPYQVNGNVILTWPLDILYQNQQMIGFVMPRIHHKIAIYSLQRYDMDNLHDFNRACITKYLGEYTLYTKLATAYALAWITNYLHSKDIIIGDLNANNILLDLDHRQMVFVDCDSYCIKNHDTHEIFPCCVGQPEFLSPELQHNADMGYIKYTKESDDFALGIHLFRLLLNNQNPFGGIDESNSSLSYQSPFDMHIANGDCPYVKTCGLKLPKGALLLDVLSKDLQQAFKNTFYYDANTLQNHIKTRTTAKQWEVILSQYCKQDTKVTYLKQCKKAKHIYFAHNKTCPICRLQDKG